MVITTPNPIPVRVNKLLLEDSVNFANENVSVKMIFAKDILLHDLVVTTL